MYANHTAFFTLLHILHLSYALNEMKDSSSQWNIMQHSMCFAPALFLSSSCVCTIGAIRSGHTMSKRHGKSGLPSCFGSVPTKCSFRALRVNQCVWNLQTLGRMCLCKPSWRWKEEVRRLVTYPQLAAPFSTNIKSLGPWPGLIFSPRALGLPDGTSARWHVLCPWNCKYCLSFPAWQLIPLALTFKAYQISRQHVVVSLKGNAFWNISRKVTAWYCVVNGSWLCISKAIPPKAPTWMLFNVKVS